MKAAVRQLSLFSISGSFAVRLGAEFFSNLPETPGVYFFYSAADELLYIGQSHNLRKRIGSYRFVTSERQSKRIARLAHRIARVEYELCGSAAEAIQREAELLLKHRPPFNRAGVWIPPPVWLALWSGETMFHAEIVNQPPATGRAIGPLPSSFRYVVSIAMRMIYRLCYLSANPWEFPLGMMGSSVRKSISFTTQESMKMEEQLLNFIQGSPALMEQFQTVFPTQEPPSELELFWLDQLETMTKWQRKHAENIILEPVNSASANADATMENSPWTTPPLFS